MIRDKSRAHWFGASDSSMIMGNWNTESFRKWWAVKLGAITTPGWTTPEMQAGTYHEHAILSAIGIRRTDRQIRIRRFRLRVNLDGEDRDTVYEVKTTGKSAFKLSKAYWMQTQVEMWATHKQCVVITYRLTEEDYRNYFLPIDPDRVGKIPVAYDAEWIRDQYLPRVKFLARCLRKGTAPWVETAV